MNSPKTDEPPKEESIDTEKQNGSPSSSEINPKFDFQNGSNQIFSDLLSDTRKETNKDNLGNQNQTKNEPETANHHHLTEEKNSESKNISKHEDNIEIDENDNKNKCEIGQIMDIGNSIMNSPNIPQKDDNNNSNNNNNNNDDNDDKTEKLQIDSNMVKNISQDFVSNVVSPKGQNKDELNSDGNNKDNSENRLNSQIEAIVQKVTDKIDNETDENQKDADNNEINENHNKNDDVQNEKTVCGEDKEDEKDSDNKLSGISTDLTKKLIMEKSEIATPRDDSHDDHSDHLIKSPEESKEQSSISSEDLSSSQIQSQVQSPSNEILKPRLVTIRKDSSKTDASTQLDDSTSDGFFTTAIDSPRIRPEGDGNNQPLGDSNDDKNENSESDEDSNNSYVPPLQPIALYSAEELHSALQKQLKTKKLPPIEMREELINYSRKQSLYKLMAEDYDSAARIDEIIDANMKSLQEEALSSDAAQQNGTLAQRLEHAQNQKVIIEENYRQKIDEFKKMEQNRIEDLQLQHESDRRKFEGDWMTDEKTRGFNKPSAELFQIRRQQKALAICHEFAKARSLKKIGDQMQKEESHSQSTKAANVMRTQYVALLARQEKEMQCLVEYGKRRLGQIETMRDEELKANEIYRNALKARIENPKQMKRPRIQFPQTTTSRAKRGSASTGAAGLGTMALSITGVVTGRTRSQFANFKKSPEKTRLEIKLGDVRKITKPLTPSPRKGKKGAAQSPFAS